LSALENPRVYLTTQRPRPDDVVDVDHRNALAAARLRERLHVLDDVLLLRMLRGAGLRERAALDHHVVLQVLDDQPAAGRIQGQAFVVHRSPPSFLSACRARGAGRRACGWSTERWSSG